MDALFKNQGIVVVGGSSGIGRAAAGMFMQAGAKVTVTGRNAEKLAKAAGDGLTTERIDSNNREALLTFFQDQDKLDHLVISLSGSKGGGDFFSLSLQVLHEGFDEKFWPVLNTLQAALPHLNEGGSVTLVTAISATSKLPGTSGLAAINGALECMVPAIAKEWPKVRINAVSPGVVNTDWWGFLSEEDKQAVFEGYSAHIPIGRVGHPDEIASAILFLAANTYMTGKVIACDGGMT